jgi:hypothetical protein
MTLKRKGDDLSDEEKETKQGADGFDLNKQLNDVSFLLFTYCRK